MNEKTKRILFIVLLVLLTTRCRTTTTRSGTTIIEPDYIKPENIAESDYAIRERISQLERQIGLARSTVSELRESGQTIRDVSGRSANTIQEIIEQMEVLIIWIDWATGCIQYLESVLADEGY